MSLVLTRLVLVLVVLVVVPAMLPCISTGSGVTQSTELQRYKPRLKEQRFWLFVPYMYIATQ